MVILDTIKNTCDSSKVVKTSILTGIWKKLIPTLKDYFELLRILVEEITVDKKDKANINMQKNYK